MHISCFCAQRPSSLACAASALSGGWRGQGTGHRSCCHGRLCTFLPCWVLGVPAADPGSAALSWMVSRLPPAASEPAASWPAPAAPRPASRHLPLQRCAAGCASRLPASFAGQRQCGASGSCAKPARQSARTTHVSAAPGAHGPADPVSAGPAAPAASWCMRGSALSARRGWKAQGRAGQGWHRARAAARRRRLPRRRRRRWARRCRRCAPRPRSRPACAATRGARPCRA